jgi:hypothetical protein
MPRDEDRTAAAISSARLAVVDVDREPGLPKQVG